LNGSFAGIGSSRIAMRLARTVYHWAEVGGSDAHTATAIGCAHTVFTGSTAADLRRTLEARETEGIGVYWGPREYMSFVSHRMRHGNGTLFALAEREPSRFYLRRRAERYKHSA